METRRPRIGVIGTGVAGLGVAWNLRQIADIALIEQDQRVGGHTNTVTVDEEGQAVPIDTGFIVFNKVTYPNLVKLFTELDVPIKPSEMSFSVQHVPSGLEYNGMGINKVFAQRRNLLRPKFHRMLGDVTRFFRLAKESLADPAAEDLTVRQFAAKHGLGNEFLEWYLIPMSSAVWSTLPSGVLDFPSRSLHRFFFNHGFLGVDTHHAWFTVDGGAKTYVDRILGVLGPARVRAKVVNVSEQEDAVCVRVEGGEELRFDRVILACHGDQSLAMLAEPTDLQRRLLSPFGYQHNHATLHTDASVMPKRRLAWASWNYRIEASDATGDRPTTHYWMNALQGVSKKRNYFVSINGRSLVDPSRILYETDYEHPVFTLEAMRAQAELRKINQVAPTQRVFFCGSYFRYGFHEDAYASAVECAEDVRRGLSGG